MSEPARPPRPSVDFTILPKIAAVCKERGRSVREVAALVALRRAQGELARADLSRALGMTAAETSRLLNALEDAGLVFRAAGEDRRVVIVCLDDAGWDALDTLDEAVDTDGTTDPLSSITDAERAIGEVARAHGITRTQALCLLAYETFEPEPPRSSLPTLIAARTGVPRTSAASALWALRDRGLVG